MLEFSQVAVQVPVEMMGQIDYLHVVVNHVFAIHLPVLIAEEAQR